MNQSGFLVYKCRRCGEKINSVHVPNLVIALVAIMTNTQFPSDWGGVTSNLLDMHSCKDGHIGIADLIGGEKDDI